MRLAAILLLASLGLPAAAEPQVVARLLVQESPVAGYRYHDGKKVWKDLRVGDRLDLVREPDNPFDPRAVRVDWQGHVLGYVPRLDNEGVSRQLDLGAPLEARIVRLKKSRSPRQRILLEITTGVMR
ncbi:MAG: HIRAN domain-containing protein [Sulfuricella sp.]|nr:HIRAN domain-containing protein [Sulfuricella sp.]